MKQLGNTSDTRTTNGTTTGRGRTPDVFRIPIPPGPTGLEIGLAILDLLEERYRAELVDFDLGDGGGHFAVQLPARDVGRGSAA